jgi:hypothetical protein
MKPQQSEDSDRIAIAIGCYWLGTVEADKLSLI